MEDRPDRIDFGRLALPSFVVILASFAALRALAVEPWAMPAYDLYAYWLTRDGLDYAGAHQGDTGAFLYAPAFAQVIAPLTALPWPVFAGVWTVVIAAPLAWLAGRHAIWLLLLPPVLMSVASGQLDLAFAAIVLLGLRWPALWVLPILTKVTPGIGLLWFLVRGEWRALGIAALATALVAAASAIVDPLGWAGWIAMLARMDFPELGGGLWFLPLPLGFRLFVAAALIAWGAATDRRWVLPVGVCLSLPTVWLNSPTILIALLPLVAAGARTPAGAWLRRAVPAVRRVPFEVQRRQLEAWFRRAITP
ncbi:MAG: glycosyltransferase 87 family protein [Chloroflexota bacterium]